MNEYEIWIELQLGGLTTAVSATHADVISPAVCYRVDCLAIHTAVLSYRNMFGKVKKTLSTGTFFFFFFLLFDDFILWWIDCVTAATLVMCCVLITPCYTTLLLHPLTLKNSKVMIKRLKKIDNWWINSIKKMEWYVKS